MVEPHSSPVASIPAQEFYAVQKVCERLRAALKETLAEAVEHRKNIIEARDAGYMGIDAAKFRGAYDQEIARFDGLIERARTALGGSQ